MRVAPELHVKGIEFPVSTLDTYVEAEFQVPNLAVVVVISIKSPG